MKDLSLVLLCDLKVTRKEEIHSTRIVLKGKKIYCGLICEHKKGDNSSANEYINMHLIIYRNDGRKRDNIIKTLSPTLFFC